MKIIYSPNFLRKYKKLPIAIKKLAEKQENIFRKNSFDARLNTHKPHGRLKEFWSFSIDYEYRIIFEFAKENIVYFHSTGKHKIYQ